MIIAIQITVITLLALMLSTNIYHIVRASRKRQAEIVPDQEIQLKTAYDDYSQLTYKFTLGTGTIQYHTPVLIHKYEHRSVPVSDFVDTKPDKYAVAGLAT